MFSIPVEYLMWGGIGFCLAWLIALMVMPAVHNRAVRLARQRYEDLPLSMQEIRAEKDTIRAGFAAATRELEVRIDKLKDKTAAHATDLAKKNQVIERLKHKVDTVTAALRESEEREQAARDELRAAKRGFADKDVTLGAAEGEITALQRDLAAKEAAMRSADRELKAVRDALATKDAAIAQAEQKVAAINATLRESEEREQRARDDLRETKRGAADRETALGAFEGEVADVRRELAAKDAALRAAEQDVTALRSELAGKDVALTRAETEINAIKAEIAALTTLLLNIDRTPAPAPSSEVVPFVPAARQAAHAQPSRQLNESQPRQPAQVRPVQRPPLDITPAPTRLVPPAIPPAPQNDDEVKRASPEMTDTPRRADGPGDGPNQRLRAAYAPLVTTTN